MSILNRKSEDNKKEKAKEPDPKDSTMSLGDHLEDLRRRLALAIAGLIVGAIVCLCFGNHILKFIKMPYEKVMGEGSEIITISPADGFIAYMKVSLVAGLLLSSLWVFYHLWMFVAAGLYPKERRYVKIAVPFSATLFISGALFFLFYVAPLAIGFFHKFDTKIDVKDLWTLGNYISFITTLMLVFGIAFQTPIVIFILNKTGLVSIKAFRGSRKFVILGCFVVAAISTPPDIISQVTLAIPLYFLYELGILICVLTGSKKKTEAAAS